MILTALLLAATSSAAPQRIYQCGNARGEIAYQDRPCEDASRQRLNEGSEQALRRWLEDQRAADMAKQSAVRTHSRPANDRAPGHSTSNPPLPDRSAAEERLIASCSERFLHCAGSNAAAMDACVASLPRCGQGRAGCCPAACIQSYQNLRRAGEGQAAAVRLALLDPLAPSCASQR